MCKRNEQEWREFYERRRARLLKMLEYDAQKVIIEAETRMLLEACHRGPWRATYALVKHGLSTFYWVHIFLKWEWIRTRVFRRPQDEALAACERIEEEEKALAEMANQL